MPAKRRWLVILLSSLVGVMALAVAVLAFLPVLLGVEDHSSDLRFDPTAWKHHSHDLDRDNPRGKMVADLSKQLLDRRPRRNEVIELLGDPDHGSEPGQVSYNLGMWSGFRMDYDSLDIDFDGDGRVRSVRSVQH